MLTISKAYALSATCQRLRALVAAGVSVDPFLCPLKADHWSLSKGRARYVLVGNDLGDGGTGAVDDGVEIAAGDDVDRPLLMIEVHCSAGDNGPDEIKSWSGFCTR